VQSTGEGLRPQWLATARLNPGCSSRVGVEEGETGIGPASICTIHTVAGGGVPQLTAIMDSVDAAHRTGTPLALKKVLAVANQRYGFREFVRKSQEYAKVACARCHAAHN
jgi:hypothetical protein